MDFSSDALLKELPQDLKEPYVFVSELNGQVCQRYPQLSPFANSLPGWIPQRIVAAALCFKTSGIEKALSSLGGKSYIWASEFENVHSFWRYSEPSLTIDGKLYSNSETYFHSQKPIPFDKEIWEKKKVSVMRKAVRAKYHADLHKLKPLLLSTGNHPLLSLKHDSFWGFHPQKGGENMLALLWMEIRGELLQDSS